LTKKRFRSITRRRTQIFITPKTFASKEILAPVVFLGQLGPLHTENFDLKKKSGSSIKLLSFQRIFHAHKILHFLSTGYVFDLRAIESSMLFAVFRPLRTPVPNGQSSHI
jgi:hypothetical protein